MFALIFKWVSVVLTSLTVAALYLEILPSYHTFTSFDKWLWILGLGSIAWLQILLILFKVHGCYVCRLWSDFILQLTGLSFICLSGVFGAMYPPFSWAMGVFPIIGILYLAVGRSFSLKSRDTLKAYDGTNTSTE